MATVMLTRGVIIGSSDSMIDGCLRSFVIGAGSCGSSASGGEDVGDGCDLDAQAPIAERVRRGG